MQTLSLIGIAVFIISALIGAFDGVLVRALLFDAQVIEASETASTALLTRNRRSFCPRTGCFCLLAIANKLHLH